MLDYVAEELAATTGWRRVLEAYASLTPAPAARRAANERGAAATETLGFVPRLSKVEGVDPEQLSSLHGKLIALGLLTFEVSGKSGMQYQLSPLGYRTLGQRAAGRRSADRDVEEQSIDEATADEADDSESAAA